MPSRINGFLATAILAGGCATMPLPAPQMGADWKLQQGQAVWTPPKAKNGIAGELLVATNSTGDFVVEFSKPPIAIANAQRHSSQWQVEFPAQPKRYGGRGTGPSRIIWLHLSAALSGQTTGDWKFTTNTSGWRLERNGESLEGFLAP